MGFHGFSESELKMRNMQFPFAPLERYGNGGYETFAVMSDGEILCADCVNDPTNPVMISPYEYIRLEGYPADWTIVGIESSEGFDSDLRRNAVCSHCGQKIG